MGTSILGIHIEKPVFQFFCSQKTTKLIPLINKFICYNQGKYIQFEYLLGLKHKLLKAELKENGHNPDKVKEHHDEILRFTHSELKNISTQNFEFILEYFEIVKKSKLLPRVCIKGANQEKVVDLFRNKRGPYYVTGHPVKSNSGFAHVFREGIWFLENDIPSQAKEGRYVNPRLDDQRVRNYNKTFGVKLNKEKIDVNWMDCWVKNDDATPALRESCYKSTLIIPMTLRNNEVSDEFIKKFFTNEFSKDRTIWQFLCFDHPVTGYFDDKRDKRIGYIFADILSLYFIAAFIHTENSENFEKAAEIIKKMEVN